MSDNYLNDSDFLLVIFDLLLIIGIIRRRKYELLNNLKLYENYMKIGMNYMKIGMNYMKIGLSCC